MSAEIKGGDRVKATHISGDTSEFEVVSASAMDRLHGVWVAARSFVLYEAEGWSFEVIERAKPPLPTAPGLYGQGPYRVFHILSTHGEWFKLDFTASPPKLIPQVPTRIDKLELVFDHRAYRDGRVSA